MASTEPEVQPEAEAGDPGVAARCPCTDLAAVTERSALAAGRLLGRGDPEMADEAASVALSQAADHLIGVKPARFQQRRIVERDRRPELGLLREAKARRGDPDDGQRAAVHGEAPAHRAGISGEAALPESVADDGDAIPPRRVLAQEEVTAGCGVEPEDAEVVGAHQRPRHPLRPVGAADVERLRAEERHGFQGAVFPPVQAVLIGDGVRRADRPPLRHVHQP